MKRHITLLTICFFLTNFWSCGKGENDELPTPNVIEGINAIIVPTGQFAKDDGSQPLSGSSAQKVTDLLTKAGPDIIKDMGQMNITEQEFQEIKAFTDKLVVEAQKPLDVYGKIFRWITSNIQYASGYVNNDPYPVFQTKQAICQGYANLLNVMLFSQNIPVLNVNGMLNPIGGHAWNYVYLDDWYVSDPTNNGHFRMSNTSSYTHLVPMSLDVDLFEDENFVYHFYEEKLNLREVKKSGKQLIVPFSVKGFQIEAFNPNVELPSNIEEIYIGKNIESLGENIVGLNMFAPSVKYAFVEAANTQMDSYSQVVYRNSFPYYIPASAILIQCKALHTLGKNFMKDHTKIETIIIQSGTQKVEAYAFENCPNLKKAYIPKETIVDNLAFDGVHKNFQIVRF